MATQSGISDLSPIQRQSVGMALIYEQFYQASNQLLSIFDMGDNMVGKIQSGEIDKEKFNMQVLLTVFTNIATYFQTGEVFKNANKRNVTELKAKFSSLKQQCETFVKTHKVFMDTVGISEDERSAAEVYDKSANEFLQASTQLSSQLEGLLNSNVLSEDITEVSSSEAIQTICSDTLKHIKTLIESFENIIAILNPSAKKSNIKLEDFSKLDILSLYQKFSESVATFNKTFEDIVDEVGKNDFFSKPENVTRYDELCSLIEKSKSILNSIVEFDKQLNPADKMDENEKGLVEIAKKMFSFFITQGNSFLDMIQNTINTAMPTYLTCTKSVGYLKTYSIFLEINRFLDPPKN
ncbi:MAG: hypothetical protein KR126chlam6_00128 [Candidatus Anoxychlamydiales bacterium]|nr:hypothetical protein [Candidatus Anoxychlamydiales bacterium]